MAAPAARLHEQEVGVAVVAPLELHDDVAPGEAARDARSAAIVASVPLETARIISIDG